MASLEINGRRTQHVFLELEPDSWIEIKNNGHTDDAVIHQFLKSEETGTKHLRFDGNVFGTLIQDWADMEPGIECSA